MRLHREGNRVIAGFALLSIVIAAVVQLLLPLPLAVKIGIYVGLAAFMLFVLRFFRSPDRTLQRDDQIVLSPADGKVVVIEEVVRAEYFGDRRIQVSIFMSPYDIHVNWVPVSGKVVHHQYYPGRYLVAWHPKSSMANERTSVVIRHSNGEEILVRQIAGAVARRVICYAREGKHMEQGDELGFIRFGSRVDLLLPPTASIHVSMGQRVTGRETIIASLGEHSV